MREIFKKTEIYFFGLVWFGLFPSVITLATQEII